MIPHRYPGDIIDPEVVDQLLTALGQPPTYNFLSGEWWPRIARAAGVTLANTVYPLAIEWNAAVDYANTLTPTKENT